MKFILTILLLACSNNFRYDMELSLAELGPYHLINDLLNKKHIDNELITSFKDNGNIRSCNDIRAFYDIDSLIKKIEKEEKKNINYLSSYWYNSDHEIKLFLAYFYGYRDEIKLLTENAIYIEYKKKYGDFALIKAVEEGCFESIMILLKNGAKVDLEDKYGYTVFMKVLTLNYFQPRLKRIASLLLSYGANINYKNSKGETALNIIIQSRDISIIYKKRILKFLLEKGAVTDNIKDQRDLLNLVLFGRELNIEILLLIKQNQILNCSRLDNFIKYRSILENAIYIEYKKKYGDVALIEASKKGCFEGTRILLENGAKVDLEDKYGCTAFIEVLTSNYYYFQPKFQRIADLLISYGANINHKNFKGETALTIIQSKNKEAVKFLLEKGAIINEDLDVLKDLFNLVIIEKDAEDQRYLLNLVLFNEKKLNIKFLLFMYKQSLNYKQILKPFFIENLLESINIRNLFVLDAFTFKCRSLFIDTFLNVIEIYNLTSIEEVRDIKIKIIELFLRYYEEKLNSTIGYEDKFTYNYYCSYNRDNIKNKIGKFVSKIYKAVSSFSTNFTNEDLISQIVNSNDNIN